MKGYSCCYRKDEFQFASPFSGKPRMASIVLQPVTTVMVADLSRRIDVNAAYHALPIVHIFSEKTGTRITREATGRSKSSQKIEFFGEENVIISVRYNGCSRGVRQGGKQMRNVASMDLQVYGKNVHMKVSSSKIQLTGARDENMGRLAFQHLCDHLNTAQMNLDHLHSLEPEVLRATINWVREAVQAPGVVPNSVIETTVHNTPPGVDSRATAFLISFRNDFDTLEEFVEKISYLTFAPRIVVHETDQFDPVTITRARVCNGVYNCTLNQDLPLIDLTIFLQECGYYASYHNVKARNVSIAIPATGDGASPDTSEAEESDAEEANSSKERVRTHRVTIYSNSSIRLSSPTFFEEARSVIQGVVNCIQEFLNVGVNDLVGETGTDLVRDSGTSEDLLAC